MARTIEEIQEAIKVEVRLYPSLDKFLFPEDGGSFVGVFNLIIYIVSLSMFTFEVLQDGFKNEVAELSLKVPAGNPQWVRQQILNFQLGNTIQLTEDFIPFYPDPQLPLIIVRCSVTEEFSSEIQIKVAKEVAGLLTPLTDSELSAVEDYYFGTGSSQGIGFAGVRADFLSTEADRMGIVADVYYLGQSVEATVKADVISAINNYFVNLGNVSFNGTVVMNDITATVEAVPGVDRFQMSAVEGRDEGTPQGAGLAVPVNGIYETIAGYIIQEDAVGFDYATTFTMIRA